MIATLAEIPHLLKGAKNHFETARHEMKLDDQNFEQRVVAQLEMVRAIELNEFLQTLTTNKGQLVHIGRNSQRPEGLIFSIVTPGEKPKVAKLYYNSGIKNKIPPKLLRQLYPLSKVMKLGEWMPIRPLSVEEKTLNRLGETNMTDYFSSAEILVRVMAHEVLPETMALPIALINEGKSVGFYLEHDQQVTSTQDMTTRESFFDFDEWSRLRDEKDGVPSNVIEAKAQLENANVHLWQESWLDLQDQLLFDKNMRFLTFGRLGYLMPGYEDKKVS